jgi:hypothetical protein
MNDPYPTLLQIYSDFDNFVIIDLKKETMTFEVNGTRIIHHLGPYKVPRSIEPIDDFMEKYVLHHIYHMNSGKRTNYINPKENGSVSWSNIHSFENDLKDSMHEWKNWRYDISSPRCLAIIYVLQIGAELCIPLVYDGLSNLEDFINNMKSTILENWRIPTLDMALRATLARWWATHKEDISTRDKVQVAMKHSFVPPTKFDSQYISWA